MFELCDLRQAEWEFERKRIIEDMWITKQLCELINIYTGALEFEMERCAETIQMLNDYYVGIISGTRSDSEKIEKYRLGLFSLNFEGTDRSSEVIDAFAYTTYLFGKTTAILNENSVFHKHFVTGCNQAKKIIKLYESIATDVYNRITIIFKEQNIRVRRSFLKNSFTNYHHKF